MTTENMTTENEEKDLGIEEEEIDVMFFKAVNRVKRQGVAADKNAFNNIITLIDDPTIDERQKLRSIRALSWQRVNAEIKL